jgi:hypothetical protein
MESVALGDLLEHLHREHVVVRRDGHLLEDRRELELARRDLVVARLDRDAELPEIVLEVHHEREHALADRTEVVVLELLALRRLRAEERPPAAHEVRSQRVQNRRSIRKYPARARSSDRPS